ncbi:TRAP transporter small permease [Sneathiella chinensis]|uniref:TRAP transporter small permease protein n=1 Tax=Sneathiella chinensis TaxID=349750 RepID=A0ABQ5TY76_9PROT|nr:TRAP transporter small permease subunit [Sneathiella chinensis]GLQ04817.1 hypothetical protein GCM10007924_00380 [Sneathiella chinensis]
MVTNTQSWTRAYALVHRLCEIWALAGGVLLLAVVLVNAYSITADILFGIPLTGDFELTEMGIAIAIFSFLPYCQITGSNVSADIFTMRAGRLALALMGLLAGLLALAFSLILLWRMSAGLQDYITYEEVTAIFSIPIWIGFIPALVSLCLLVAASLMTAIDCMKTRRRA